MCSTLLSVKGLSPLLSFVRNGHRLRGKAPGVAKTLSQRLAEENYEDPALHARHDIGFPLLKPSRSTELRNRLDHLKKQRADVNLEKQARSHELKIDLSVVKDDWIKSGGPFQVRKLAEHYQIFEHLFGKHAFFTPRVSMDIKFKISDDVYCPVYHGNRIKPSQAVNAPDVVFNHKFSITGNHESDKNSLWTLVLTNLDGSSSADNSELIHWMVGNIPDGASVLKGDVIVPYMQPVTPKGTGYHRHVFVLYKQEKKINLDQFKVSETSKLEQRTFNSFDFYKKLQDDITPAGLSFFQSKWDDSITSFYHNVLNTKEPIYEYDFPKLVLKTPKKFPHRQPFNLYMDRYADPKDVNKRFLEEKLAKTHPFDGPEKKPLFPNSEFFSDEPSWLKSAEKKKRLERGRIRDFNRE